MKSEVVYLKEKKKKILTNLEKGNNDLKDNTTLKEHP